MAEKVAFVDFETTAILPRPEYPPVPVGVAIRLPTWKKSRYMAWGHPTENNCTKAEAAKTLKEIYKDEALCIAYHHAKFDTDVGEEHLGLKPLRWDRVHDTMVLAYLVDPHAKKIGLKELAESRLGIPPTERDDVREWLIDHGIVNRANKKTWGASISKAPGKLVGKYAEGDTDRTKLIFESLLPEVKEAGMSEAYDRERRLIPVLLENERKGVRVDLEALSRDVKMYESALEAVQKKIFKLLGREFNIESGDELADALDCKYSGISWPRTETGKRSTSKDSLDEVLEGRPPLLLALFQYHASVLTCVRTFMRPWMETAEKTGGWIHTQWNSVAQSEGGGSRTGRLSSSPNFQNIPTLKSIKFARALELWGKHLKKLGLPPLPQVRSYIIADSEDHVILDRDFSQQELRVLAHFEDGEMMQAYLDNPKIDFHDFAAVILFGKATKENRKKTKNIAFGLLYGMGIGALAALLGVDTTTANRLKTQYLDAFPGIRTIQKNLKAYARENLPMRTWGGRRYYCEPPRVIKDRLRTFDYKMFNYLIQGSASDITKEAMLRYSETKKHGRIMLTVHDQILVCVPKKAWKSEMKILKVAMNGIDLGAPLISDGEVGYRWTALEKCE